MRRKWLTIGLGALMAAAGTAPARAESPSFDWYGLGGCTVPVVGMPIDFANVQADIPPDQRPKVLASGAGQAGLLFVFIKCPQNSLVGHGPNATRADVTQVLIGVLYQAATAEDADKPQFYLLASLTDWQAFVAAERGIGIPSELVDLDMSVVRDPATALGTFDVDVPWQGSPFVVDGQITAANQMRDFPQDAVHFFQGSKGFVRVHHDEEWALGNLATATITATGPDSRLARWMGAPSREAIGLYVWISDEQHVHRYTVDP